MCLPSETQPAEEFKNQDVIEVKAVSPGSDKTWRN